MYIRNLWFSYNHHTQDGLGQILYFVFEQENIYTFWHFHLESYLLGEHGVCYLYNSCQFSCFEDWELAIVLKEYLNIMLKN